MGSEVRSTPDEPQGGLPPFLLVEHIRIALGLKSASGARKMIRSGRLGPFSKIGRRMILRRESFLKAVKRLERATEPKEAIPPAARPRYVELLRESKNAIHSARSS